MSISKLLSASFVALSLFLVTSAQAEVSIKGMAEISYDSWSKPDKKEIKKAKNKAVESAISRWASKQGGSFLKNFETVRPQVIKNLNDYVFGIKVVDEETNKDSKTYSVVIKAELDDVRLKNLVSSASDVANASEDDLSYMTFVFVSRRQALVQSFDDKVYKRKDSSVSEQGTEAEEATESGVEYASESSRTEKTTTGGSTTKRADKIEYTVSNANEISIAMTEVFGSNGFEVVEAEYLEEETDGLISVDAFKKDFSYGDDISSSTRRNAAKGARMVDIPFIALGTLDIGMQDKDPSSGLTRVFVTVTGKLISVKKRFPKTVASVGPVQFAGVGPNQTVAERNALKLAAQNAANELVNQMNAKGVK
jgi:hypothetical protein